MLVLVAGGKAAADFDFEFGFELGLFVERAFSTTYVRCSSVPAFMLSSLKSGLKETDALR